MPKDATIESSAEWHWCHYNVWGTLLWAQMEHHVCTGFGVSGKTYGSTTEKLLYGIGQGSCASPILWALINQLLLAALGEKCTCIRLVVIDVEEEHIRPGDSFVYDTTTGTTNDDSELEPVYHVISDLTSSEETIIAKMEKILQFFLDLLQVTGGDLAPEKCVWHIISHRWKDGKPILLQKHSSHRGIKIVLRSTNTESGVKSKAPTEGHRTLGFFMTGDGTCTAHKKVMKEKASLYATAITPRSVWKGESGLAYNLFYLPSIGYVTLETTLSQQECYDIQKPVVNVILPKIGISRKAHRSVVFGAAQFGGLGLEHLAAYQGHNHLQYLMGHLRCNSTTGKLMRSMLDYTQLECGCSEMFSRKTTKGIHGSC
jgi:hypothetical protein